MSSMEPSLLEVSRIVRAGFPSTFGEHDRSLERGGSDRPARATGVSPLDQPSSLSITAPATSLVPTAVGSSRVGFMS